MSQKDKNGAWGKARNLKEINSTSLDYCPFIDFPRGNLYFTSNKSKELPKQLVHPDQLKAYQEEIQNGLGNIYSINLDKILE